MRTIGVGGSVAAVALLALASPCGSSVVRVPADRPTIQSGIDASADGDTVLVAPGTYFGAGNRDLEFGAKSITLAAEPGSAPAIIECGGSSRAMTISDPASSVVVRGFTIQGGRVAGGIGGGILVNAPSALIENCVLLGNTALHGGGLYCGWNSMPTIRDCVFVGNEATSGGAMYCETAAPTVARTIFSENLAYASGGAIASTMVLPHIPGTTVIEACSFDRNRAWFDGGAISLETMVPSPPPGGPSRPWPDVRVADSEFTGNVSWRFGGAAAAWAWPAGVLFERCVLSGNVSEEGGGIYGSGCIRVADCTFGANQADVSGGAMTAGEGSSVEGCTFFGNGAPAAGSMSIPDRDVLVDRCVIASGTDGGAVSCEFGPLVDVTRCVIWDNVGGDDVCGHGAENVTADPLFCDPDEGYDLCSDSPCLPANNQWGVLVGAHAQDCGPCGTHVQAEISWGLIKALYRR